MTSVNKDAKAMGANRFMGVRSPTGAQCSAEARVRPDLTQPAVEALLERQCVRVYAVGAEEEPPVVSLSPRSGTRLLGPTLCLVVLLIMIIAVVYALWISVGNYSSIGV